MSIVQVVGAGSSWPSTPAPDPFAANLVLALPLNVSYGIRDASSLIRGSGVSYSTTIFAGSFDGNSSQFYGSSLLTGSASGSTTRLDATALPAFGTGDFCIETWLNIPTMGTGNFTVFRYHNDTNAGILFLYNGSSTFTPGALYFANGDPAGSDVSITPNNSFPTGQWNHIAVTRSGNTLRIFINGISSVSYQPTGGVFGNFTYTGATHMLLGGNAVYNNVRVQDYRVYQGAAKYTSNFTPPGAMFV